MKYVNKLHKLSFKMHKLSFLCLVITLLLPLTGFGGVYRLPPPGEDVVGKVRVSHAHPGQVLWKIGRRYDIGIDEMIRVNPHIHPTMLLHGGTRVVIPSQFILPPGPRRGVVINLAELRLYYYPPNRNVVITKPVGIGKEGWATPKGVTKIVSKRKDPYWRPTANVRAEAARNGHIIPKVFPPGPLNPLGRYAMRLGWHEYLIHGTNRPDGVGGRASAGCLRMYNDDIKELYSQIPIGTEVRIISQPFKVGWRHRKLYLEAHEPLTEDMNKHNYDRDLSPMVSQVYNKTKGKKVLVKWASARSIAKHYRGIPEQIGRKYKQ